jgi:hypothetical protein
LHEASENSPLASIKIFTNPIAIIAVMGVVDAFGHDYGGVEIS